MKTAFEVVIEPEYSKSKLLELQSKYDLSTDDVLRRDRLNLTSEIPVKDFNYWIYQYRTYVAAGGDPEELKNK
jgi:hypothetical protein